MTPEQEANAIGKFAASMEEVIENGGNLTEIIECFGKALLAITPNVGTAMQEVMHIMHTPDSIEHMRKLGFREDEK